MFGRTCIASVALAALFGSSVRAQLVAPNISLTRVATGLSAPLFVTAPEGDSRLFVVERSGRVRVIENGVVNPTPVVDFASLVNTSGERGFLGMAFAPDFATSRAFYVNYSNQTSATRDTTIARYILPVGSNSATLDQIVYTVPQHGNSNHKGGWIGFRPGDGNNLYIAMGDSGAGNDPLNSAQNVNSQWGKILRVTVGASGPAIPAVGNPFNGTNGRTDIWAYGLRNPFRNSFDRLNGDFFIGDVGQDSREEINVEEFNAPGRNYGWRPREGTIQTPGIGDSAPGNATGPVFEYTHSGGFPNFPGEFTGSITGGYVYRGTQVAPLAGRYIFADYISGRIGSFTYNRDTNLPTNYLDLSGFVNPNRSVIGTNSLVSFGEDGFGELYAVSINGSVFKFTYNVIPEPSSLALLIPAIALVARRKR